MSDVVYELLAQMTAPSFHDLKEHEPLLQRAEQRVRQFIPRSPLRRSEWLSELTGGDVWLKLDGLNPTGSFKVRGAINALATRIEQLVKASGDSSKLVVVAASAGNHAQGVAYAAREMGCQARIYLPEGTSLIKQLQTKRLGATVIVAGDSLDEAFAAALGYVQEHENAQFLHAFNDFDVILGQGTCLMECFEQFEEATAKPPQAIDAFLCAIGGGGLAAGSGLAMKLMGGGRVIGVEQEYFDSARASLLKGEWLPVSRTGETTLADGIRVRLIGRQSWEIMRRTVSDIQLVSDDHLVGAITGLCENENVIAEGAGAAGVALLLKEPDMFRNQTVVAAVCGGNIDNQLLSRVLTRGLRVTNRVMRVVLDLGDRPGELARALTCLASAQANVLEVHHDRTYSTANFGLVEVDLSIETKDKNHQIQLIELLSSKGFKPRVL